MRLCIVYVFLYHTSRYLCLYHCQAGPDGCIVVECKVRAGTRHSGLLPHVGPNVSFRATENLQMIKWCFAIEDYKDHNTRTCLRLNSVRIVFQHTAVRFHFMEEIFFITYFY